MLIIQDCIVLKLFFRLKRIIVFSNVLVIKKKKDELLYLADSLLWSVSFLRDTCAAKRPTETAASCSLSSECLGADSQYGKTTWPGGIKLRLKDR